MKQTCIYIVTFILVFKCMTAYWGPVSNHCLQWKYAPGLWHIWLLSQIMPVFPVSFPQQCSLRILILFCCFIDRKLKVWICPIQEICKNRIVFCHQTVCIFHFMMSHLFERCDVYLIYTVIYSLYMLIFCFWIA